MKIVVGSLSIGIICLFAAKRLWNRGRGGQMTYDSIWLGIFGLGAFGYAAVTFVDLVTRWLDNLLTDLTNWVNALLSLSLPRSVALLLVFGVSCIVIGGVSIAVWYGRRRFMLTK